MGFEDLSWKCQIGEQSDDKRWSGGSSSGILLHCYYILDITTFFIFGRIFFHRKFYLIYFPCDVIFSCIYIYGLIPISVLKAGYIIAKDGKIDGEEYLVGLVSADELPWMKLFENLGEAIPQAILSLVFLINNFSFEVDSSFMPIPTTCISLFFSIGSIMMGLYSGCSVCWCSKNSEWQSLLL